MTKTRTRARRQATVDNFNATDFHGEIITWNFDRGTTQTHARVRDALAACGLPTEVEREFLPRNAFTRAIKKLKQERIVDVVREDEDRITFQFTQKHLKDSGWTYDRECFLQLNKITGIVACDTSVDLQREAQAQLDACMEERTTSDLTRIVQRLFERDADLIPVRDQGGCYFVPQRFVQFIEDVQSFVGKLGGSIVRFPVPKGSKAGDASITNVVAHEMQKLVAEHMETVKDFSINTRADTIERAAAKIKSTRVKIEAYANYLQDQSVDLLKSVDGAKAELARQVSAIAKQQADAPTKDKDSKLLFGQSVTAVIRWMGKEGWDVQRATDALRKVGHAMAKATVTAQLAAGRKGTRGEPATLTKAQIKELGG